MKQNFINDDLDWSSSDNESDNESNDEFNDESDDNERVLIIS